MPAIASKAALKSYVTGRCKSHFFDRDTMRFFNSRLVSVHPGKKSAVTYFVTSEKFTSPHGDGPRTCKLRKLSRCTVDTLKEFPSCSEARKTAQRLAKGESVSLSGARGRRRRRRR